MTQNQNTNDTQTQAFFVPIDQLTPSQLYISEDKLSGVQTWFHGDITKMDPIPVKRLAGRLLMTDGHTRATAALLWGAKELPCIWDTDDMDWAAYAADISLCGEEGITSVEKLATRIVSGTDYQRLWYDRCDALRQEWYYKVLCQGKETIYFTRKPAALGQYDIRPFDMGAGDNIEYFRLYDGGIPAAQGCIERYSYEFWEAADIKTFQEYRSRGFGYAMTAFLTNQILQSGKTATCRTMPQNGHMRCIIDKCGYQRLYDETGYGTPHSAEKEKTPNELP